MSSSPANYTPPPVGTPCWVEIPAVDVKACKAFYAALFPSWTWKPATAQYPDEKIAMFGYASGTMGDFGGGILKVSEECKASGEPKMGSGVTLFHFVENIEETQKRVEELGGKSLSGKNEEGEHGWFMYFKDVAENRFGIYGIRKPCESSSK